MPVRKAMTAAAVLSILSACEGGVAYNPDQPLSVGAGISTMGLVIEPNVRIAPTTGVRLPVAFGSISTSTTIDGVDYDVEGPLGGVGVVADYYPGAGGFRVSGGLFKSNFEIDGNASGSVEVGSNTYVGVDLDANIKPKQSVAPYVGVGYEGDVGAGWSLSTDLGVKYIGGLEATASEANGVVSAADLDAEVSSINDELSSVTILPYLKFGATYRW